jgi:Ca2+-binding EF-hand superfamily protein
MPFMVEFEMRLKLVHLLATSAMCLGSLVAPARASSEWIVSRMGNTLHANVTWEQVRSHMLAAFYASNPEDRGVTMQGIDNLRKISTAQRRSQVISQILIYDLDGNGSVTKEEIATAMQPRARQMINANGVQLEPSPQQVRLQLEKLIGDALKPDADRDGVITAAEIEQEAQKQAEQISIGWQQGFVSQLVPMTLDHNGDGAVSLAEYEAAVREQFDAIDQDRDGRISADETAAVSKRLNEARQATQREREAQDRKRRLQAAKVGCDVPAAPAGVKTVLLGAHQGRALSNAWIGSQDRVTHMTSVEIAPGSEPIYLALASGRAMIWDIVGATERIAGIVAHAEETADGSTQGVGKPLVGILGVPREKIRFTAHPGCLIPPMEQTMKDGSAQESAALLLGRAVDEIGGEYSAGSFRVPAARHFPDRPVRNSIQLPKEGLGELLWREVRETFPAGIAYVDAGAVISVLPVKHYSVLPERAGLAELVDTGSLAVTGTSRGIRINDGDFKPFTLPDRFRISGKLRLPAGATGTFILPRQTPPPEGDLSAACILSEADMKPISGSKAGCS